MLWNFHCRLYDGGGSVDQCPRSRNFDVRPPEMLRQSDSLSDPRGVTQQVPRSGVRTLLYTEHVFRSI